MSGRPKVIAHRGASSEAPENTLAAFRRALEIGADAIELDVHLSADGHAVVIHDATLERTTPGSGRVESFSRRELAGLDVPALAEVVSLAGLAGLVIELKEDDANQSTRDALAQATARALGDFSGELLVQSFDAELLSAYHAGAPATPLGFLVDDVDRKIPPDIPLAAWNPSGELVRDEPGCVARMKARGLLVYVWTINEPEHFRQLAALGVDGIITDEPRLARETLGG